MKKLLIMIGLIGSVYGSEISVSSWSGLIGYCNDATNITETICGNSVTFDNVYTLKSDNTNYTLNVGTEVNMPASTKLVIPSGITLNLTNSGSYKNYYMSNNSAIEINGILNKACYNLYGPNEEGTESTYTNAYIIVNGTFDNRGNEECKVETGAQYSKLYILGSGTINNISDRITAAQSNSEIIFSGNLTINNSAAIYTSGSNTSIKFSLKNPVNNSGFIYTNGYNSSIIISKDTTIINKGGSLYTVTRDHTNSLIVNGTIAFEKGEGLEENYPVFSTINTYTSCIMSISGGGAIDLSGLIDANMKDGEGWSHTSANGGINIPKEAFRSITPFTGTIKLPYNTTCTDLDLSNATEATILVPVLNREGIILESNKITKEITITKLTTEEFSKLNITLPRDYDSYDTYNIYQNTPFTIPNILNLFPSYNVVENYIITDELDETIYEINEGEDVIVNFGIKGRTPLDLRGSGKITFKGDNSEYRIPRPKIKFDGEKSVFPRDAIYDHVEFADGCVIPENTIIVAKNPQNISNITVNGHLILE